MFCPNCKQEFDGKFCPECGTKLIDKVSADAIAITIGDGSAVNELHTNDSRTFNTDNSVHNTHYDQRVITNNTTNNTTNNIVERQRTSEELKNESKSRFAECCQEVYQDGILTEDEKNFLKRKQLELGLTDDEASHIIELYRNTSSQKCSTLNTSAAIVLSIVARLIKDNASSKEISAQIPRLKTLANQYDIDEVQFVYYMVMAAIKPDELINEYELNLSDRYWRAFWVYIAYLKKDDIEKAESSFAQLSKFQQYSEDNCIPLTAVAIYNGSGIDMACEHANAIILETCSAELRDFIYAIFEIISPERLCERNTNSMCNYKFYVDNLINIKGTEVESKRNDTGIHVTSNRIGCNQELSENISREPETTKRITDFKIVNGIGYISEGMTIIEACPSSCSETTANINILNGVIDIAARAFSGCKKLTTINLPDGLESIGEYAFYCCRRLTHVSLPDTVHAIGEVAFGSCQNLMSINIPTSVRIIEKGTFLHCSKLSSITIPPSVIEIKQVAFAGCTSLTNVKVPKNAIIAFDAFDDCPNVHIERY